MEKLRYLLPALLLASGLLCARPALAATSNISFSSALFSTPVSLTYSPDGSVTASGTIRVSAGNSASSNPYSVYFNQVSISPTVTSPKLPPTYKLQKSGGTAFVPSTSTIPSSTNEYFSGNLSKNSSVNLSFTVSVEPTTLPFSGTYTVSINATLDNTTVPSGSYTDRRAFSVIVTVNQCLDVSVVPSGSGFAVGTSSQTLAFSPLSTGSTAGVDLVTRSNVSYSLALSSTNGWALLNATDGVTIPYTVKNSGSPLTLVAGSPVSLARGASATYANYLTRSLLFTVGDTATLLPTPGDYGDSIAVTLSTP